MKRRKDETSYKQTAFGIIPRRKLIPLEIEGVKRMWDMILKKHKSGRIPVTPDFIQKVHLIGFGWFFPETCGKWRTIDVTVSGHKPPAFFMVPQMMKDFTEDIRVRVKHLPDIDQVNYLKELMKLLSWVHHRFLWIHPFTDYNGRMGRLLLSMIMLNLNLPPIELKVETKAGRQKYVKALQEADKGNDMLLQELILKAINEAAESLKLTANK